MSGGSVVALMKDVQHVRPVAGALRMPPGRCDISTEGTVLPPSVRTLRRVRVWALASLGRNVGLRTVRVGAFGTQQMQPEP